MNLNALKQGLEQKLKLLNEKIEAGIFIGYDQKMQVNSKLDS